MFEKIRSDALGGVVAASVAIPLSLGFGMFVFVTLGDEYFVYGAIAGMTGAIAAGFTCVLLGERAPTIHAPRIPTTFFLGLLLYGLATSQDPTLREATAATKLMILFSIILFAGILQALFGLLRLGTLMKFAPHPVMAGFQNMAAVLMFLAQVGNVLGYEHNMQFTQVPLHILETKPLSLLVGIITVAAMWNARRITTRVPPLVVGMTAGLIAFYSLRLAGFDSLLGPLIGMPPGNVIVPHPYEQFWSAALVGTLANLAPTIATGALALAVIATIDAMLCAKLTGRRDDSNRMLVRLGLANAVSATAGGVTNGINIGATLTNRAFGGRSWISVAVNAVILLLTLKFALPLIAYIPRAVISGVVMVVAIQHLDGWSLRAAGQLLRPAAASSRSSLRLDLAVALLVSILSIAVNIVLAVFLGVVLAVLLFVVRMSGSNVRRSYRCDGIRSRKARTLSDAKTLETKGHGVLVMELQSAIFFGSAERLMQTIDAETRTPTKTLILDLRRVTEIDSTGVQILGETAAELARRDIKLTLVSRRNEIGDRLLGLPAKCVTDVDRAIELAEDDLLREGSENLVAEMPLGEVSLLRELTPDQLERLKPYLQSSVWPADSVIFRQGDPGSHLFLVTRGRASVRLATPDGDIRLATFAPGTVFGELAILDRGPRSATVTADDEVATFGISDEGFLELQRREPDVAIQILSALGRELSSRLRHANTTIQQLEA